MPQVRVVRKRFKFPLAKMIKGKKERKKKTIKKEVKGKKIRKDKEK